MDGTIKTLNERRFGFIAREGEAGAKDLFFHENELKGVEFDTLKVGDKVTFDFKEGEPGGKGPSAVNVTRV